MKQYETAEITLQGAAPQGSCAQADITAVITGGGTEKTIKGFYAGNDTYKVRFLPKEPGTYQYHISGCVQQEGTIVVEPADSAVHGMVTAQGEHFMYEDKTPYFPFGTTVYAFVHQTEELVNQTMTSLAKAPFN